jgi:phosphate transport system substrate-binding protein
MQRHVLRVLSVIILIAMITTACGLKETVAPQQIEPTEVPKVEEPEGVSEVEEPDPEESGVQEILLPKVNPSENPGDIVSAGSSTVFPLAEAIAGLYEGEGGGNVTIDSIGSCADFERFCVAGEIDISNASRPIKNSEVESCAEIGRTIALHVYMLASETRAFEKAMGASAVLIVVMIFINLTINLISHRITAMAMGKLQ